MLIVLFFVVTAVNCNSSVMFCIQNKYIIFVNRDALASACAAQVYSQGNGHA